MKIRQFEGSNEFKCIGGSCVDSCCVGWFVEFDKKTCEIIISSKQFEKIAQEHISLNEHVIDENINYCSVTPRDDNTCPFLTEKRLCSIQLEMGEEGLSTICALYPRYYNRIDGVYEKNFSLACIEVAQLMLTQKDGLKLIQEWGKPERNVVIFDLNNSDDRLKDSGFRYLDAIRSKVYVYLNSADFSLHEKLNGLLGFHRVLESTPVNMMGEMIASYDWIQTEENLLDWNRLKSTLADTLISLDNDEHPYIDAMIERLKGNRKDLQYFDSRKLEYAFTNYMLMYMQKEVYPFTNTDSKLIMYFTLAIRVMMMHLLMGVQTAWNEAEAVRFIQSFSKAFDHDGMFHHRVHEMAQKLSDRV